MRQKLCFLCKEDHSTLYRIKYSVHEDWVFACKKCLTELKNGNPHYRYGGTWKR
jgi:hypothetical protein